MTSWHRANDTVWHPEHPDSPPLKAVGRSCVSNAITELHNICVVRWDAGPEHIVAYLGGLWTGGGPIVVDGREYPAYTDVSDCLDLVTGEEFRVSSEDKDVAARKIGVRDLPPALRDAWPRDEKGRAIRPGFHVDSSVMNTDVLRRLAGSVDVAPLQGSLF